MRKLVIALTLAVAVSAAGAQFAYDIDSPLAAESFRTGVEAFGRGYYAESLAQLERALSSEPRDPLILYWLGKAYLRLGLPGAAFERWNDALAVADGSPFVESRLELAGAMASPEGLTEPTRYVRVSELPGSKGDTVLFSRPSWIEPLPDGKAIVVSHGTDRLLVVDANGRIVDTVNAGSTGFDRPFACARLDDGTLFVTEFQADRIARLSPDGRVLGYSGDETGPGRLSGPQYIAADADGFVYVTDVGFSRVVKYSRDGSMMLSFGVRDPSFDGLSLPTGVAVVGDVVYVADAALKAIFSFDRYGNYLGRARVSGLSRPEGIRSVGDGRLLVADGSRVLLADPESGATIELYRSERRKPRILSAAFDANGELLAADFDASEIAYLSDPASRFAGLSVEVGRVYSDSFPRVSLDVTVKDRRGRPVTGLGYQNFYISELVSTKERRVEGDKPVDYIASSIRPAAELSFDGSLDRSSAVDLTFLLEGSPELATMRLEARDAAYAVYESLGAGTDSRARLVVAGRVAQPPSAGDASAIGQAALGYEPASDWRFDSGLRLAAGTLFGSSRRRAVVYLGTGSVNEAYLDGSSLAELASLLESNGIALYAVIVGKGSPSEALSFLVERSGGSIYRADRPEGLAVVAEDLREARTGRYRLSYLSSADDGFGKSYLPFSVEVYLRDRSGKDESGFFAPLR
ncbi:MAG TPA: tetratricopeptide repeat protein [Spirochaetia bacterium]|nr:tetratricopeptide repeat protein [Spirochaetales bacterium]HRW23316.1 tetratricopeptide repeat protein [Spirochaetia bacterium]